MAADAKTGGRAGGGRGHTVNAGEDNEISFATGDVITEIEKIDENWWRGRSVTGGYGLFPANYVQEN